MNDCTRINMWSGPRNVSTAVMYAFAQRPDTRAVDEPLYGHYLKTTGADHPSAAEVMAAVDCDGERVVGEVILGPCDLPVLFFKNMAHHLVDLDRGFLRKTTHFLLTRDPVEVLPSLAKNLTEPSLRDTGYQVQETLFDVLRELGQVVPVIDARQLLLDPCGVLTQLCQQLGLPFDANMLHWPAGPKPEDGVWAGHWYHTAHRSTRFAPYRPKSGPFPERLKPLLEACQPHYARLYEHAIKVD